jgi:hypothetical protein
MTKKLTTKQKDILQRLMEGKDMYKSYMVGFVWQNEIGNKAFVNKGTMNSLIKNEFVSFGIRIGGAISGHSIMQITEKGKNALKISNTPKKEPKNPKLNLTCSICGKKYKRKYKPLFSQRELYCNVCQEPTLIFDCEKIS